MPRSHRRATFTPVQPKGGRSRVEKLTPKKTGPGLTTPYPRVGQPGGPPGGGGPGNPNYGWDSRGRPRQDPNQTRQAPNPAAAATSPTSPGFVPSAAYNTQVGDANKEYDTTIGDLDTETQNTEQTYGINDPTNPFNKSEGLKRAYLAKRKAASAGLASQGQLYSGAHERALARVRFEEERDKDELRRAYEGDMDALNKARVAAGDKRDDKVTKSFEDWLAEQDPEVEVPDTGPAPAQPTTTVVDTGPVPEQQPQVLHDIGEPATARSPRRHKPKHKPKPGERHMTIKKVKRPKVKETLRQGRGH